MISVYRQIRASQLTKPATNTILWSRRFDFVFTVQFQNLFRAEFHTDAATLAVVLVPFEIAASQGRIDHIRAIDPAHAAFDALFTIRDRSLAPPVARSQFP